MKKYFLMILSTFYIIVCANAGVSKELNFEDICFMTLKNSKELMLLKKEIINAEITIKEAYSNLWPNVGASASYSMFEDEISFDLNGEKTVLRAQTSKNVGFYVDQPLFQFRVYHLGRAAKSDLKSQEYYLEYSKSEIVYKAVQIYLLALSAKQNVIILNESLNNLKSHHKSVSQRFLLGDLPETALLETEYELKKNESDFIEAESVFESLKDTLSVFIGESEKFELKEDLGMIEDTVQLNHFDWTEVARNSRSDLKQLGEKLNGYEFLIKSIKMEYFPSLSAFFNLDYNLDTTAFNPEEETMVAGLKIDWPIWERGRRLIQVKKLENLIETVKVQREQIYDDIKVSVSGCIRNIKSIDKSQDSKSKQISLGKKLLELRKEEFKLGVSTAIDVSDANVFLLSAKRQYVIDVYSKYLNYLKLLKETGKFHSFLKNNYNIELS